MNKQKIISLKKPNDVFYLFEIEDKKYIYVGEKVITFETNDMLVKQSSEFGFNDVKFSYAYGEENIYFMLHQNYFPNQEYESSTEKDEYQYLYKKDDEVKVDNITDENEGFVEYGNFFL